jgi:hypothetical protein
LLIDLKLVHMLSIAGEESAKGGNSHWLCIPNTHRCGK